MKTQMGTNVSPSEKVVQTKNTLKNSDQKFILRFVDHVVAISVTINTQVKIFFLGLYIGGFVYLYLNFQIE